MYICMVFKKLPEGMKRIHVHFTINPKMREILSKIADKEKIPESRVIDRMIWACRNGFVPEA